MPVISPGATILIVDDEEPVRELAQLILERSGYRVVTAAGGEECVAILRARGNQIDAVLLDRNMPELDGPETFDKIRTVRPDVPVLLASAFPEEFGCRGFPVGGIAGYLKKPYEADLLVSRIRASLAPPVSRAASG